MIDATKSKALDRSHRKVALVCGTLVAGMIGASFAAAPFYKMLCNLTSFDGTPQRATAPSDVVLDRMMSIRFDANVAPGFPWSFEPLQRTVDIKIGETTLAFYRVTNLSDKRVTGTATFNVFPESAGAFFNKLQCFCFTEQTLEPGQSIDMPVSFFIDPRLVDDKDARDTTNITLSYTFYQAVSKPGLAAKPAKEAPATPRAVSGDGRAG
jgi:cytochrome c oxidase assembly protein subunit 11